MVDKRRSKDYKQVCGHIPVTKYRKFKSTCIERDTGQSDAIEQAIDLWITQEPIVPVITEDKALPKPQTLQELVAHNAEKLQHAGIKNLQAIINGEVLPTKTDFIKIAAALGLSEEEQRFIWTEAFTLNKEIPNGHP